MGVRISHGVPKIMKHKYTKKDFKMFKTSCESWLNHFGITEYEIDFKHHDIDTPARCTYDVVAKLACFQLAKTYEGDFCLQNNMVKLAFHEVMHLLLAEYGLTLSKEDDFMSDACIAAEHTVVQRLIRGFSPT